MHHEGGVPRYVHAGVLQPVLQRFRQVRQVMMTMLMIMMIMMIREMVVVAMVEQEVGAELLVVVGAFEFAELVPLAWIAHPPPAWGCTVQHNGGVHSAPR